MVEVVLNTKETQKGIGSYKMLVLDLDDTLLNDNHSISAYNKEMLLKAQESGVKVVLASGRPTPAMMKYAHDLKLAEFDSYIISYNGGMITEMKNQQVVFERSLTKEEIHSLHDFSIKNKVHIITYTEKGVLSETESEYIDVELSLTGMAHHKVSSFKDEVKSSAVKCILLEEPSYLKTVESKLKSERSDLSVSISKPFFLEVMPQGIDKAASIDVLASQLGIKQEEIIAVGNAGNDLSMIQYAGLGVWVDNVPADLRHHADVVVASNNNDGVAEVVKRFILMQ
jgi:Cof subfamily protein (haloacid dehalogenase superfamily)